ncbi:type II 3-dehydroquinate dehydratase [Mobilicoccus massiliensis]|uniref:type II 3-dehydroquinate dehydratase n=1 Tax=Mobilicoccus massiliensis TaxID=1522310 RepID=UPI00058F2BB6|nr:type II 3-dehydroquinate dehydratase [Mobilicoccus massiliensis]
MTTQFSRPLVGVLNGPNLNLLGTRQPEIYGRATLADIERRCGEVGDEVGLAVECVQSNHEGALVDAIQEWRTRAAGFVVNAAAYTHTSIALRDALLATGLPLVEVHLSNVHARDEFRHRSYLADIASAVIAGCGPEGYEFALRHLAGRLARTTRA